MSRVAGTVYHAPDRCVVAGQVRDDVAVGRGGITSGRGLAEAAANQAPIPFNKSEANAVQSAASACSRAAAFIQPKAASPAA